MPEQKQKKKKRSDILITALLIFAMLTGVAVFCYPAFSSWWNARVQTRVIDSYNRAVGSLDDSSKVDMLEQAHAYNTALSALPDPLNDYRQLADYDTILDVTGTGIIGYIDIPKISVHLPIYHGTSPEVLNDAVGHLEGTSFPVGGANCHSVISAHRGLPSAKLFTDLDRLTEDDRFTISVLDEVLTYEVETISVVRPFEMSGLRPVAGRDLVTLMTCTPYGINTHRLLVQAHRIDTMTEEEVVRKVRIPADAVLLDDADILPVLLLPIAALLLIYWTCSKSGRHKKFVSAYTVRKATGETERKRDNHAEKE